MSWAWSKPVDVYLGQEILAVHYYVKGKGTVHIVHGLDAAEGLKSIEEVIPAQSRIRVHLSGVLCPAFELSFPKGAMNFAEKMILASATAAQTLGLNEVALVSEFDDRRHGIATALQKSLHDSINLWAKSSRHKLLSMKPNWSIATQVAANQKPLAKCLQLQEPDGTTILAETEADVFKISHFPHGKDMPKALEARVAHFVDHLSLTEREVFKLRFDPESPGVVGSNALAWSRYWLSHETH